MKRNRPEATAAAAAAAFTKVLYERRVDPVFRGTTKTNVCFKGAFRWFLDVSGSVSKLSDSLVPARQQKKSRSASTDGK